MPVDERRVGLIIRALRRRRGWRQVDLAAASRLSQAAISRAERGHIASLSLARARRILGALDARVDFDVRWRGGELDRLVDARHAVLATAAADVLLAHAWRPLTEVTYSLRGERGAIDLLGVNEAERAVLLGEVKSELTSWEETQRRFDQKVRLLPLICADRFGWRPRTVATVLIFEESMTNRRRVGRLGAAARAFPARGHDIRRWLRKSDGPLAGFWFLSPSHPRSSSEPGGNFHRVRRREQRTR